MPREFPLPSFQKFLLSSSHWQNTLLSVSFGRPIDRARWQSAWERLLARHPVLRSNFSATAGSLLEHGYLDSDWSEPDWSGWSVEKIPAAWETLQREERERLFPAGSFPLWRLHLLKLPGDTSHFLWTLHPALLDKNSAGRILLEWFSLYDGSEEKTDELTSNPAVAAGAIEISEDMESVSRALEDLSDTVLNPFFSLNWGRSESSEDFRELSLQLEAAPEFAEELTTLAQNMDCQLDELLEVAWGLFLARLNGKGESLLLTGVNLHSKLAAEHAGAVGYFQSYLPLRLCYDRTRNVHSQIQRAVAERRNLEKAVFADWFGKASALAVRHGLPTLPLNSVVWQASGISHLLHTSMPAWLGADVRWTQDPVTPVCLRIRRERRLTFDLAFSCQHLDEASAQLLLDAFLDWLPDMAVGKEKDSPAPVPGADRADGGFQLTSEPDLLSKLAEALRSTGDKPALQYGTQILTGFAVLSMSNRLARHLRKIKMQEASRFLVCLSRTSWLPIALLALLRDRSNFLFLAPGREIADCATFCKEEKIGYVLLDSGTESLFAEVEIKKLIVDSQWEKVASQSDADLSPRKPAVPPNWRFFPANIAEEAVLLGEAALSLDLDSALEVLGTGVEDRFLSTAPNASFRFLEETLVCFFSGAVMVIPERDIYATRSAFQEELESGGITCLCLPATRWTDWVHFLIELKRSLPGSLRRLILLGGRTGSKVVREWTRLAGESCQTVTTWSPSGLLGLGFVAVGEESFVPEGQAGFILGYPVGACRAEVLGQNQSPLPSPNFVGSLILYPPDLALSDGVLPAKWETGLSAFQARDGRWISIEPPGVKEWEVQPLTQPTLNRVDAVLQSHPQIFDAISCAVRESSGEVQAWLVPVDSNGGVPVDLASFHSARLPGGPSLNAVARISKWPVQEDGSLDVQQLPATEPLSRLEKKFNDPTNTGEPQVPEHIQATLIPEGQPASEVNTWLIFAGSSDQFALMTALEACHPEQFAVRRVELHGADWKSPESLRAAAGALPSDRPCILLGEGPAAWDAVRLAAAAARFHAWAGELLLVAPPISMQRSGWKQRLQNWFSSISTKGEGNSRRDFSSPRLPRCAQKARILLDGVGAESFMPLFADPDFYDADLSSAATRAAAIVDVLATKDSPEPEVEEGGPSLKQEEPS